MRTYKEFLTTQDKVIAHNVSIDHLDVIGAVLDGAWIGRNDASVQLVRRTEDEIRIQLQAKLDYLKCLGVTLRQVDNDVVAHVDFAANTTADHNLGYDFSDGNDSRVPIATSPADEGYGVAEISIGARYSALVRPGEIVNITAVSNGRYFCADDWGHPNARPIRANRPLPAEWEAFSFCENEDCTVSIVSATNGKFLSAEINADGRLVARASVIDAWEKYWVECTEDGHVALRSAANHKLLSVEPTSGTVSMRADVADSWEKLTVAPCRIVKNDNAGGGANSATNIVVGVATAGGMTAAAVGATAAVIGTTTMVTTAGVSVATITAAGAGIGGAIGGVTGAILGAGSGVVFGPGVGIPGVYIFSALGATNGATAGAAAATTVAGWLGIPMATTVAVTTVPVWAIPVAVCGGVAVLGAGVVGLGRCFKWW